MATIHRFPPPGAEDGHGERRRPGRPSGPEQRRVSNTILIMTAVVMAATFVLLLLARLVAGATLH